jgi:PAS domain S-box-containing protein
MTRIDPEEPLLRSVALQNASTILLAREKAEEERRTTLEALRTSEERLQAIFHHAAVGIAVADLSGRFIEMNQKFAEIVGYSPAELSQLTFREITFPEDLPATIKEMGRLLAGEISDYSLEKRYVRRDGGIVWSSSTVTLLKDAAGQPMRFVGVVQDITERKAIEEALREESRSLELLSQTGVILGASKLDLETLVQAAIDAATEICGAEVGLIRFEAPGDAGEALPPLTLARGSVVPLGDLARPPLAALFAPGLLAAGPICSDDARADPRFESARSAWPGWHPAFRSYLAIPIARRHSDVIGGFFFLHSRAGAFSERAERMLVGVAAQAAVAIDNARLYASVRKAADERMKLLESERLARSAAEKMSSLKDDFLATLSHELRTPLSAILGWTQVLRLGPIEPEDLRKGLETIERNARVQTKLIEELLDMSRVTSGKVRLDVQEVDPSAFVEAAIEAVRPAADAKGIRITKLLDPWAGPISGDPGRLQQVVWNLLSNAIKFTPKDGSVEVQVQQMGAAVEIRVSDTGIGIQSEFLPLVFERFRQADASSSRTHGGLGLGLAIVKHLVELHGGTVTVSSEGGGRGATFVVHLPLSAQRSTAHWSSQAQADAGALVDFHAVDLTGTTIVAVDDDTDAQDLIRRVLSDCAATVFTAGSAAEALRLVESEHPDLVVSDIGMPDVDGFELLRRLRRLGKERGGDIPVIALTAFARPEDRHRALQAGFSAHVAKPIEPSVLVASVANVSGHPPGLR